MLDKILILKGRYRGDSKEMTQREMIVKLMSNTDMIGKRVKIKDTNTKAYLTQGLIDKYGTVKKLSSTAKSRGIIGVAVDEKENPASAYGLFWFYKNELDFIENESEDIIMENFEHVAIVNLVEDYNKKDYAFALHEDDFYLINDITKATNSPAMVVVNARGKNNRQLAIVKQFMPVDIYTGTKITAEVVGVVNMNNYIYRETEKARLEELAKKRAAIEAELEKEINKRKSVEYYEEMAKKYADNPRLAELVGELRGLGA